MNLIVNGRPAHLDATETIDIPTLLIALKVETPDYVTVELNGEILAREDFPATFVKEGDAVEFLYFMGGGR